METQTTKQPKLYVFSPVFPSDSRRRVRAKCGKCGKVFAVSVWRFNGCGKQCPKCKTTYGRADVELAETELNASVGLQKPTVRLSKQASEFLKFLNDNNIDGSGYFEENEKKQTSETTTIETTFLAIETTYLERNSLKTQFPITLKWDGIEYNRSISIVNYIRVSGKAEVYCYEYGSGGNNCVENKEGANLFDPESTKAALAKAQMKGSTKKNMVARLDVWFKFNEIKWKAPTYSGESEIPYIPTEAKIDQLIASLGKKTATFCQILKDTGARCGEIAASKWTDIDFGQRKIRIKAEKGSNSRVLSLSAKTIEMLCNLPRNKERIFANSDDMRSLFYFQRKKAARRLADPDLMLIHFHTFRHWKATTEQHRTKDPWYVKMLLGHKSIKSTETYIHLEKMLYLNEANDQFTVKVANTLEDAIKLMEVGFEYHAEVEGNKLFRKRK